MLSGNLQEHHTLQGGVQMGRGMPWYRIYRIRQPYPKIPRWTALSVFRTLQNVYLTAYSDCSSLRGFLFSGCCCSDVVMEWVPRVLGRVEARGLVCQSGIRLVVLTFCHVSVWHVFIRWVSRFSCTKPKYLGCEEGWNVILQLCVHNKQLSC